MANATQNDLAIQDFATTKIMDTHLATLDINTTSALAIMPSFPHSTRTAVAPIPVSSMTSQDIFHSSPVPKTISVVFPPIFTAEDTITRNTITNATPANTMHNQANCNPPTAPKADAQQLTTNSKFQYNLAEEGLTWADDTDLPPIPVIESKPGKVVVEHPIQERPKGLMDSRWAHNTQSVAERQILGHKFKRELSHYGVKNVGLAKGASKPPRPAPQPTYQHSPRPVAQCTPQPDRQIPLPPYSHPGCEPNQARRWNRNRDSYNGNKNSRHYENKVEEPYNGPRLIMDMGEFKQEVEKYGLKTLKDSRWANTEEPEKDAPTKKKVPERVIDTEESQCDVKKHGLKSLKDSRWENAEEPKKSSRHYGNKVEKPYNGPRLIMDMEEFQRDVKKYGLKTLKDSRWAS